MMMFLVIHFVVISHLPLCVIGFIACQLITHFMRATFWFAPAMRGAISADGSSITEEEMKSQITATYFTFAHWFIRLKLDDGKTKLIWRDSVDEAKYRHLLVVLKKGL